MNKTLITLLLLLAAATIAFSQTSQLSQASSKPLSQGAQDAKDFNDFKAKYGKKYSKTGEENLRFSNFLQNKAKSDAQNKKAGRTYTTQVNHLSDLSEAEFAALCLGLKVPASAVKSLQAIQAPAQVAAVTSIDWVGKGKVTPVKNQGYCGSCWSFSAVAALESSILVNKNVLNDLSEQQLVDCSSSYGNSGCNGGWMNNAFLYMKANGISRQSFYPYVSGNTGLANACKARSFVYKVSAYYTSPAGSGCTGLLNLLANRPVSVAVDASGWSLYKTGIFNNCGTGLNHGVLVVAYDSTYWKIKNSWGTGWGEAGYIRLAPGNSCNVCNYPSYPVPV